MSAQDGDVGLLVPGAHRARGLTGDRQVLRCLVRAEVDWVQAQAEAGLVPSSAAQAARRVLADEQLERCFDLADLAERGELGGNPVIPVLADLRAAVRDVDPQAATALHRGLTSQDVLDTALMLVLDGALAEIGSSLRRAETALARRAQEHRSTISVARTLTQHALPSVFGLRCAQWLEGLLDAHDRLRALRPDAAMHRRWARALGLSEASHVWHTSRQPVLDAGAALGSMCAALGKIADDVLLLSRPELGELREPTGPGRGVSSAMPQKQNPVLSVQLRRTALSAPQQVAALFAAASSSVDERPDGAWHVEWPALRELLRLSLSAASQLAELCEGLKADPQRMEQNLRGSGPALLSERIVAALKPHVPETADATAAQRIQQALAGAGPDADRAVDALEELTAGQRDEQGRTFGRDRLAALCDPRGYLGAAEHLIDRAVDRQARSLRETRQPADDHDQGATA